LPRYLDSCKLVTSGENFQGRLRVHRVLGWRLKKAMELFLNILWLMIAVGALCVWRVRWVRQPGCRQRTSMQQWTAFLTALVLLFFAVSLTDDLHSEIVLYDECASGRKSSMVCSCGHPAAHGVKIHADGGFAILPRAFATDRCRLVSTISREAEGVKSQGHYWLTSGRAPPVEII
jgi:hypothetical protein